MADWHGRRLLVVVAHPDDETFGCGSLLLHAAAAGAETAVVCATRGEAGGTGEDLGAVRERELRDAAAVLNVGSVDLLDYRDSGMSGAAGADTLVGAPFEEVRADVEAAVAAFRPDVLVTLDASDSHRDHVRIRDAALAAAEALAAAAKALARAIALPAGLSVALAAGLAAAAPEHPVPRLRIDAVMLSAARLAHDRGRTRIVAAAIGTADGR